MRWTNVALFAALASCKAKSSGESDEKARVVATERPQGEFGAGVDEVGDRFGLGQIEAAVQKGAPGEFAGLGKAGAGSEDGVKDELRREQAAVAGDFDYVLAGERARGEHDGKENFVQTLPCPDGVAEMDGVQPLQRLQSPVHPVQRRAVLLDPHPP